MKKTIILALVLYVAFIDASAQKEDKTAESFLFAIKNDVYSLFELEITDKADKKVLETKFKTLISTLKSTGMNPGKLEYSHCLIEKLHGLNKTLLIIFYDYEGKRWDDLFILIETDTYKIVDIGSPEKAFLRNTSLLWKNSNNPSLLSKQFYPNLPTRQEAIDAAKKLIALSKADKLEEMIPLIAYRGQDDPNRKNLSGPLNPKIAQDRTKASSYLSAIRSTFTTADNVELSGRFQIYPEDATCYLRLFCNDSKNYGDFRFVLLKGKYLLTEFK